MNEGTSFLIGMLFGALILIAFLASISTEDWTAEGLCQNAGYEQMIDAGDDVYYCFDAETGTSVKLNPPPAGGE